MNAARPSSATLPPARIWRRQAWRPGPRLLALIPGPWRAVSTTTARGAAVPRAGAGPPVGDAFCSPPFLSRFDGLIVPPRQRAKEKMRSEKNLALHQNLALFFSHSLLSLPLFRFLLPLVLSLSLSARAQEIRCDAPRDPSCCLGLRQHWRSVAAACRHLLRRR